MVKGGRAPDDRVAAQDRSGLARARRGVEPRPSPTPYALAGLAGSRGRSGRGASALRGPGRHGPRPVYPVGRIALVKDLSHSSARRCRLPKKIRLSAMFSP